MGDSFKELDVLLHEFKEGTSPRSRSSYGRTSPRAPLPGSPASSATTTARGSVGAVPPKLSAAFTHSAPSSPVVSDAATELLQSLRESRAAKRASVQYPSSGHGQTNSYGTKAARRSMWIGPTSPRPTGPTIPRSSSGYSPQRQSCGFPAVEHARQSPSVSPSASPRRKEEDSQQMQQLLEQLDSELLQTLHSTRSSIGSHHHKNGTDAKLDVMLQILEDVRLLAQDHYDAVRDGHPDLQFLFSSFNDSLTVLKLEVATTEQRGASLGQISSVVERMNETMVAHHRLFVRIVLSSIASSQGELSLTSFPKQECLSFPLERLWRTPGSSSLYINSFSTLVATAQQALDRVANQVADCDRIDLIFFKADCRQAVVDLKHLHQHLLEQPQDAAASAIDAIMRLRRTQASMLDFIAVIFIRCAVDLLRATCIRNSTASSDVNTAQQATLQQSASALRLRSVLASLKRALRTLALVHAIIR